MTLPVALTIAGSDSGGGAGIQADLKTFHRFGVFGTSAVTLITSQNTVGVREVHLLPPDLVRSQVAAVAEDFTVAAAKTGALGSAELIAAVAEAVDAHEIPNLVVDPVMVSKHGDPLLPPEAVEAMRREMLPRARLVTPNAYEAAALLDRQIPDEAAMAAAARAIADLGARAVVIKGGGIGPAAATDVLFEQGELHTFPGSRVETRHTHGTGCTYSAAIAALLAQGESLLAAVRGAKAFISRAIQTAPGLGHGHGPVNHWA